MVWILIRVGLFLVVTFICMFLAKGLMRKIFKIEGGNADSRSDNYITGLHRKIDKTFKDYSIVILFIILVVSVVYVDESYYWFILAVFMSTFLRMVIRAFFEWKYSKYPKQSILTLTEMCILLLAVVVVLQTDLIFTQ